MQAGEDVMIRNAAIRAGWIFTEIIKGHIEEKGIITGINP